MSKKFSIVVPVYENENGLKSFIAEINSIKNSITPDFEFIFVDDGNDYEITDCIKLENVDFKVIKNSRNSGYGFSIKRGVEKSLGNLVGIIDCDSTYDLKDLIDKFIGFDLDKNPRQVRASIGIVPQEVNLDAFFSPRKLLGEQGHLRRRHPRPRSRGWW